MPDVFKILETRQGPDWFTELKCLIWKTIHIFQETPLLDKYQIYTQKLSSASSYSEWASAASALDELDGHSKWKQQIESDDYDYKLLQSRIDEILEIRSSEPNDRRAMCFALKLGMSKNLGNMSNPDLHEHIRVGTKQLISEYTDYVTDQLYWIGDTTDPNDDMSLEEKHEYFMNLRQAHGRTALLLSGGGTLGFFHAGVFKTFIEQRLLPRVISGASSGSIIASILCTKNSEDRLKVLNDLDKFPRDIFELSLNPETIWTRIKRLFETGSLCDPSYLRKLLYDQYGDMTFQEAYNISRIVLNITISPSGAYEMPRVLNYITAPNVVILSAVLVSSAAPFIFPEGVIYAKDKNGNCVPWISIDDKYRDGSMEIDLPIKKLSELFNVNHFIVIQVNPHIYPIIELCTRKTLINKIGRFCMKMLKDEMLHRCEQLRELRLFPRFATIVYNILSQKYIGNITISPKMKWNDYRYIFSNPSLAHVQCLAERGKRSTWKQMSKIENSLKIELAIDSIIYKLRKDLLGNSPQLSNDIVASSPYITSYTHNPLLSKTVEDVNDTEEDAPESGVDCNTPYSLPPTPLWQMDTGLDNNTIDTFLPHNMSRCSSNVSINNMTTRAERRKQITSA